MKYFLHDTSAFDDEKITELWLQFGYEGLGLFYTALEKIGKQEKPIRTDILKAQLKIGKRLEKCWLFIEQIGLISSTNGESFNEQLLNFSEKYKIKKEKTRIKVEEWRKRQIDTKSVTSYVPVSNPPKVKKSKVKESKERNNENNIVDSFEFYKTSVEKAKQFKDQMSLDYISYCRHVCMKDKDGSWRLPEVLKIKKQISLDEFSKLYEKSNKNLDLILSKVDSIQVNINYHNKYTDLYFLVNNWLNPRK